MSTVFEERESGFAAKLLAPWLYPLQGKFLVYGLVISAAAGMLLWSTLVGCAFLVFFLCIGALWWRNGLPVLSFCIGFQWLFIVTGYIYYLGMGVYPGQLTVGDLDLAVILSLLGLLVIVAGVRVGLLPYQQRLAGEQANLEKSAQPSYKIKDLFYIVLIIYAVNWFVVISPMEFAFNAAQIIYRVLEFRVVFLALLLLSIARQRTGYKYGLIAVAYTIIPKFASMMSEFREVFILIFIIILGEWHPWSESRAERETTRRVTKMVTAAAVFLGVIALIWNGAIKPVWRPAVINGQVGETTMEKLESFTEIVSNNVPNIDWEAAAEVTASRMSSGMAYFSHVLNHVPMLVPYEGGKLTTRAIQHTLVPRIFYPEKEILPTDSWMIWQYAGLTAAGTRGDDDETSVGLGYMAEFYVDFGYVGMFLPIFIYGCLVGLCTGGFHVLSPSNRFFNAMMTATFLQQFASYEGEIAKLLGPLVQSAIIYGLVLYFFGERLHRRFIAEENPREVDRRARPRRPLTRA